MAASRLSKATGPFLVWRWLPTAVPSTRLEGQLRGNGLTTAQLQILWSKTPLVVRLKMDGPESLAVWTPGKGWQVYGVGANLTPAMMVEACR